MIIQRKKFIDRKQSLASLIFALLICSKLFIMLMARYGFLPFPPGMFVMGLILMLILINMVFFNIHINKKVFLLFLYVSIFFAVSNILFNGHVEDLIVSLFQYCLIGLLVSTIEFNIEQTTKYVSYMFLLVAFPTYGLIRYDLTQTWQAVVSMEVSYALVPIILAILLHCLVFIKSGNVFVYFSYIVDLYFLVQILFRGTRGATLCILVLITFVFLNSEKRRIKQVKTSRLILLLVVFILFLNIDVVLIGLNSLMNMIGIPVNVLEKSARLLASGDVSNGRVEHYVIAFKDFLKSPIFGNGIGVFYDRYPQMGYPHNIILQVLFEGGVLLGIPIIVLIVKSFILMFFERIEDINYRYTIIFLFAASVPAVMLSSELWVYPLLWMLFGMIVKKKYVSQPTQGVKYNESFS